MLCDIQNPTGLKKITTGIYEGYFYHNIDEIKQYPYFNSIEDFKKLNFLEPFGVCDSYKDIERVYKKHPIYINPDKCCIILSPIKKTENSGWRWHKWGTYIGKQKRIGCEYLKDELHIDEIKLFHFYKIL